MLDEAAAPSFGHQCTHFSRVLMGIKPEVLVV